MNERIGRKIRDNIDMFMSIVEDNGLPVTRPSISFNNRTRAAGICKSNGSIELSKPYLQHHEDDMVWDTLGHEFAHHVINEHPHLQERRGSKRLSHGPNFKHICRMIGVKDDRCHSMKLPNQVSRRTEKAYCSCKTFDITTQMKNKIARGSGHFCKSCKHILSLEPGQSRPRPARPPRRTTRDPLKELFNW